MDDVCHTRRIATYSVGYDSRSLDTSRLDGLKDIHHTFCLQTFQLRVDTQERPTPHWERERGNFSNIFKVQRDHSKMGTIGAEESVCCTHDSVVCLLRMHSLFYIIITHVILSLSMLR